MLKCLKPLAFNKTDLLLQLSVLQNRWRESQFTGEIQNKWKLLILCEILFLVDVLLSCTFMCMRGLILAGAG